MVMRQIPSKAGMITTITKYWTCSFLLFEMADSNLRHTFGQSISLEHCWTWQWTVPSVQEQDVQISSCQCVPCYNHNQKYYIRTPPDKLDPRDHVAITVYGIWRFYGILTGFFLRNSQKFSKMIGGLVTEWRWEVFKKCYTEKILYLNS